MEILNLLIGIIIGIVITYLFLKQRKDPTNELSLIMEEKNQLRISLSVLEEKNVTLITEKENQFSELAKLNGELKTITKELENLKLDNNTLINNLLLTDNIVPGISSPNKAIILNNSKNIIVKKI